MSRIFGTGKRPLLTVIKHARRRNEWKTEKDLVISDIVPYLGDSMLETAEIHAINRVDKVVKYGLATAILNGRGILDQPDQPYKVITSCGAGVQLQTGTTDEPAAHLVPARVLVNSIPIELYIPPRKALLRMAMNGITGATEKVPLVINETDSLTEKLGEVEAMLQMMRKLIAEVPSGTDLTVSTFQSIVWGVLMAEYGASAEGAEKHLEKRLREKNLRLETAEKLQQKLEIAKIKRIIAREYTPSLLDPTQFKVQKDMLEAVIEDLDEL